MVCCCLGFSELVAIQSTPLLPNKPSWASFQFSHGWLLTRLPFFHTKHFAPRLVSSRDTLRPPPPPSSSYRHGYLSAIFPHITFIFKRKLILSIPIGEIAFRHCPIGFWVWNNGPGWPSKSLANKGIKSEKFFCVGCRCRLVECQTPFGEIPIRYHLSVDLRFETMS